LNKDASDPVKHMYAQSLALSKKFHDEFKQFWDLPENWMLYEEELDVPTLGSHKYWYKENR